MNKDEKILHLQGRVRAFEHSLAGLTRELEAAKAQVHARNERILDLNEQNIQLKIQCEVLKDKMGALAACNHAAYMALRDNLLEHFAPHELGE